MRKIEVILLYALLSLVFISCEITKTQIQSKPLITRKKLEIKDPLKIDLSKNQLFIDTLRNSSFHKQLIREFWIEKKKILKIKGKLIEFPVYWIVVKKYLSSFYIYIPCDGTTKRFEIKSHLLISYGAFENKIDSIIKIRKLKNNSIKMNLLNRYINKKSKLSITKTKKSNIYLLKYKIKKEKYQEYITPLSEIKRFDLIVNHCPVEKVQEFE